MEFKDDFLDFVSKNDGRNFRQGSFMHDSDILTQEKFYQVINGINNRIQDLEERIRCLESGNIQNLNSSNSYLLPE